MTRIIFKAGSFRGLGATGMMISVSETLGQLIPDAKFVLASQTPKFDFARAVKYGMEVFNAKYRKTTFLLTFFRVLKELVKADLVIDLSGFGFSDLRGKIPALITSLTICQCKLIRKPIVLYSQAFGPFRSRVIRLLAKLFLGKADLIVARGEFSRGCLREINIEKHVYVYADSAFLLKPVSGRRLKEILQAGGIKKNHGQLLVGIAVNTKIYERSDTLNSENTYVKLMGQIVDYLVEKWNAKVVFVPHEISLSGHDDRFVAREICKTVKNVDRIRLIECEYRPEEIKALIGIFDIFVGCRFHSIIASTSMIVPTLSIGWSHKYYETMKSLGQGRYVCSYKTVSFRRFKSLLDEVVSRRYEIMDELKVEVEKAKKSALENAKLVAKMID